MSHVIEWRTRQRSGDIQVHCRTCGILNIVPPRLAGFITSRHRARHFPEFRRRVPSDIGFVSQ